MADVPIDRFALTGTLVSNISQSPGQFSNSTLPACCQKCHWCQYCHWWHCFNCCHCCHYLVTICFMTACCHCCHLYLFCPLHAVTACCRPLKDAFFVTACCHRCHYFCCPAVIHLTALIAVTAVTAAEYTLGQFVLLCYRDTWNLQISWQNLIPRVTWLHLYAFGPEVIPLQAFIYCYLKRF